MWLSFADRLQDLIADFHPATDIDRDHYATLVMDHQALRLLGSAALARAARGEQDVAALSILKLLGSEAVQRSSEEALIAAGPEGLVHPALTSAYNPMDNEAFSSSWFERYARSFAGTIAGGTSEIQRTIVAERVLGLPEAEEPDMYILYEVADKIATITLNRPEVANVQNMQLLDELDAAWTRAAEDDDVAVIVVRAEGKHFSAGHDLNDRWPSPKEITLEWIYRAESRRYLEYTLRWRNTPKPSIAAVQGRIIAGGLMLCWPCDLIIASEDALFSDPVALMGIGGVEYHGHTWELGARKAKEILFTGRPVTAEG